MTFANLTVLLGNAYVLAFFIGPVLLVVGLSLLLHAKAWQKLLAKYDKDHLSLFPMAFFSMIIGLIMVRMYNVWELNLGGLVTLFGWAALVKGVFYFLAPGTWIKAFLKMKSTMWLLYVGGVFGLLIGGLLSYLVYFPAEVL
ncbi:MAG: hypothetical protein WC651_04705 [Candidatus Gracilibacteria bacterium]|jgi:uncharacterized protein YjeT (DUF2065 family)